jgi:general secretion pathway protein G
MLQRKFYLGKGLKMRAKSGFTLVEILIVVVILGILAAIVIPQFTNASTEAKVSSLQSDLQMLRSQIELYKIQHNDFLPCEQGETFLAAMTGYTLADGTTCLATATGALGPYMRKIPSNQFVTTNADVVTEATGTCPADGTYGWWYDTATGDIRANSLAANWPLHINY